jgi:tetratricopeptide (TPR) repeat protein
MRVLRLVLPILLAACGAGAPGSTLPRHAGSADTARPATDLADAKKAAPPLALGGEDKHLDAKDPRIIDLDVIRIRVTPKGVGGDPELTSVATADLFKQANAAAKAGRTEEAIGLYRQIVADFPDSQFAPVSLFNIAAIYDGRADLPATITTLRELVTTFPDARESVDGHLYIAALQSDHQQWADAAATLVEVLARKNLTFADRIEGFARSGYVQLELHQFDGADAALAAAVAEWRKAPQLDDPYYIAMAFYYRGELMHRRFTEAPVRMPDDRLVADLEQKRVLAVQAYDRWKESLGFKQAYWATAAGYQMSQIFVELWEITVKAPYPHRIDTPTRPRYIAEVHDRVREHLEKALEGHRMNVELAHAYGVDTTWSKGSEQRATQIMTMLAKDTPGSYVTPDAP